MVEFTPAPGVRLFIVDDQSIVYSHAAQKLYAFNTAATFIWCACEIDPDREAVARELTSQTGIGATEARRRVGEALDSWRALGLIGGAAPAKRPAWRRPGRPKGAPAATLPAYAKKRFVAEERYALLGAVVRVRYASRAQRSFVHPILGHLTKARGRPTSTIELIADGGRHHICQDGFIERANVALDEIGPTVKWLVWEAAINSHRFFLNIHAGVVGDGEGAVMLPAAPGSGKSSLTAALSRSGLDYFSDEIALLEEPDLSVRPIPLAICVKSTGWDLMTPFLPRIPTLKAHRRGDGKIVRYVPPPPLRLGSRRDRTYPVRTLVFPKYVAGAETRLTPIPRVDALSRLMEECLVVQVPLTLRRVQRLVRWIRQIRCYALTMSSLDEAVGLVRAAASERHATVPTVMPPQT
jgi:hypothetical protein